MIAQFIAKLYGMQVSPSLWPDTMAITEFLSSATNLSVETNYSWLGTIGHHALEFELEPVSLVCSVLGAIFVVLMGLYLARSNQAAEPAAAQSH
jgi:hypothetical protein